MADKSFWSDKKDKKWWSNFWYYYRFRICIALVFLIFASIGLKQCMTQVVPDASVAVASYEGISDVVTDKMEKEFANYIDDIDGEDGTVVSVFKMSLPAGEGANEYQMGSVQQLFIELEAGESYLYLLDRDRCLVFADEGMFEDISSVTGDSEPVYYININDSKLLNSLGFTPEAKICAAIRKIPQRRLEFAGEKERQENAYKILKEILK